LTPGDVPDCVCPTKPDSPVPKIHRFVCKQDASQVQRLNAPKVADLCSEEGGGAANGGQLTIRCYKDSGNLVRSKMFEARATVQTVGNRRNGS
jgi:hypothetical protein